jgi:hypothetical protein
MGAAIGCYDWRDRKLREWLLLLLRFAVTREASDESAVLAMADELDSLGLRWRPAAPTFFRRTASEICDAIRDAHDGGSSPILQRHVARIEDARLRRAFRAAVGLRDAPEPRPRGTKANREKYRDLWKGLAKE